MWGWDWRLTEVTEVTLPPITTEAHKGVDSIDAGAPVLAGAGDAVVDIWKRAERVCELTGYE